MKRPWTWLFRTIAVIAMLLVLAWAVQALVLPPIVRSQIHKQLAAMGLQDVDVDVHSVSVFGVRLSDFVLGDGESLRVDAINVTTAPASDGTGSHRVLAFIGARLHASYANGLWDLGALAELEPPKREGAVGELPFGRLELRSSVITLEYEGVPYHLWLDGWAERRKNGQWEVRLDAVGSGFQGQLQAVVGGFTERSITVSRAGVDVRTAVMRFGEVMVMPRFPQPVVSVSVAPGELAFGQDKGGRKIETPPVKVVLAPVDVRAGDTRLVGLTATAAFRVLSDGRGVTVISAGPSGADVEAVQHGDAEGDPTAGPSRWRIEPPDGLAFVAAERKGGFRWSVGATLENPAEAHAYGSRIGLGKIRVSLEGSRPTVPPARLKARVNVQDASVSHPASGLALEGISATIPIAVFTPETPDPGAIAVASVRYRDRELTSIQGTVLVDHQGLDAVLRVPVTPLEAAKIEVHAALARVEANATLPPVALANLVRLLLGEGGLEGAETGGTVAAEGKIAYRHGRLEPDLRVTLDDVIYRNEEAGTALEGMSGTVRINGLSPLSSPGGQELTIDRYAQGKIVLTDGSVRFRVEGNDRVFVERTDWGFGVDGRVTAHAVRYQTGSALIDTELFVDDLNLEDWLSVLTDERVTATGRLYGRLPMKVRLGADQPRVSFGKGFLYSKAGTGTVQITNAQQVSQMLADADPRFTADAQLAAVRERVAGALSDFEYSMFRFNLIPQDDGQVTLRMQTRGKGRGPDGQEIGGLTVNINGFQDAANSALFTQGLLGGIESRLEEFFNPVERQPEPEDQP